MDPDQTAPKEQSDQGPYCWLQEFALFDSLRPINNLSVKQGQVFLGWTSTKLW